MLTLQTWQTVERVVGVVLTLPFWALWPLVVIAGAKGLITGKLSLLAGDDCPRPCRFGTRVGSVALLLVAGGSLVLVLRVPADPHFFIYLAGVVCLILGYGVSRWSTKMTSDDRAGGSLEAEFHEILEQSVSDCIQMRLQKGRRDSEGLAKEAIEMATRRMMQKRGLSAMAAQMLALEAMNNYRGPRVDG